MYAPEKYPRQGYDTQERRFYVFQSLSRRILRAYDISWGMLFLRAGCASPSSPSLDADLIKFDIMW